MHKLNIAICSLMMLLMACTKEKTISALPDGSVSFAQANGNDLIEVPLSILQDATTTVDIKAALSGSTSIDGHTVTFAVDTTKIIDYRAKYGAALLMPLTSYLFYKPHAAIAAGTSISEAAQLNIGQQTRLIEYSTYVLPVVIKSVDGKIEGPATNRVLYYVFKTGKPLFVNKTGFTITASSTNGTFAATNVLDANNLTTYWASNTAQVMPQWLNINFNREVTFEALTYYLPTAVNYPNLGGYPTSIQIETSMDGTNWTNKGVFTGNIVSNAQTINVGPTTARFLRFTVLASAKYVNGTTQFDIIFISGISLTP